MPATLTIEVPDPLWEILRQTAAQQGKSPEALATEVLSDLLPKAASGAARRWTGAWASNVPDASVRHDDYVGQKLYQELGEPPHD
jgi:hypothetical protein